MATGCSNAPKKCYEYSFESFLSFSGSFWGFHMELGGARENRKITFFTYGIFREFLAISRQPERQLFRGNKKYFSGAKYVEYRLRNTGPTLANYAAHAPTLS